MTTLTTTQLLPPSHPPPQPLRPSPPPSSSPLVKWTRLLIAPVTTEFRLLLLSSCNDTPAPYWGGSNIIISQNAYQIYSWVYEWLEGVILVFILRENGKDNQVILLIPFSQPPIVYLRRNKNIRGLLTSISDSKETNIRVPEQTAAREEILVQF